MKKKISLLLTVILFCILFPAILFSVMKRIRTQTASNVETTEKNAQAETELSLQTTCAWTPVIPVLTLDNQIEYMELNSYLTGVVLCEMPANFEVNALKAQAIVARTYTLRHNQRRRKHEFAAVCMDPGCCQGYCLPEDFLRDGGTQEQIDKIRQVVEQTEGLVLYYGEELIDATYFSCSGGKTESAVAVWGSDIPYLQSVESPGEEVATHYIDTVSFRCEEFMQKLSINQTKMQHITVEDIIYTDGGGVKNLKICGKEFEGAQLRQLLGLRSTAFIISSVGNTVTVTTKGFGHRVGMSQYGANAMASSGHTYEEILLHYFQGVRIGIYAS